jgi:hypothetical protein
MKSTYTNRPFQLLVVDERPMGCIVVVAAGATGRQRI